MTALPRTDFQDRLRQVQAAPVVTAPQVLQRERDTAAAAVADREQRRIAARPRTPPRRLPSVTEYRGPSAKPNVRPPKSQASALGEMSLPMSELPPRTTTKRVHHDITQHQTNALETKSGDLFNRDLCRTFKGWKPGQF